MSGRHLSKHGFRGCDEKLLASRVLVDNHHIASPAGSRKILELPDRMT
jgi:hypothetical protein